MEIKDTKYANIRTALAAVGKEVFIKFYDEFKTRKLSHLELSKKLHTDNKRSISTNQNRRIYRAYHIFKNNAQAEALQIIINSRVADGVKLKARELLAKEIGNIFNNDQTTKMDKGPQKEITDFSEKDIEDIINYEDETAALRSINKLTRQRLLNYDIVNKLKNLYEHRCQICGSTYFDKFGMRIAEAHHIEPFITSQNNNASNIMILCPNHHRLMHRAKPTFDREQKVLTYPNSCREKLTLNFHL
jgi:predicted restriction endonuclease